LDQIDEITTMIGYIATRWYDDRLTWNPEDWADIEMFYLPATDIWKPDLM